MKNNKTPDTHSLYQQNLTTVIPKTGNKVKHLITNKIAKVTAGNRLFLP